MITRLAPWSRHLGALGHPGRNLRLATVHIRLFSLSDAVAPHVDLKSGRLPLALDGISPRQLFRQAKVSVTDLTTKHCELRFFYDLINTEPVVETEQMAVGTSIHKALEDTVNVDAIEVAPSAIVSTEDEWAAKMLTMIVGLRQLASTTEFRELYVFGIVGDGLVTGYIDQVETRVEADGVTRVRIVDTKTRARPILPSEPQMRSAYHQVLLYHQLLNQMRSSATSIDRISKAVGLDPDSVIGAELAETFGLDPQSVTLREIFAMLSSELRALPPVSDLLRVDYLTKGKGDSGIVPLGSMEYQYDEETLHQLQDFSLGFWNGVRPPLGVPAEELSKCTWCPYASECAWRYSLEEPVDL